MTDEPEDPRRTAIRRLDAALAVEPRLSDPQIAERTGLAVHIVRRHREARGIAGVSPIGARVPWRERIGRAWGRGLTAEEIAAETGDTLRTGRQRLSELGLRPHGR